MDDADLLARQDEELGPIRAGNGSLVSVDTRGDGACLYHSLVRLIRVERRWDLLGRPDAPLAPDACDAVGAQTIRAGAPAARAD